MTSRPAAVSGSGRPRRKRHAGEVEQPVRVGEDGEVRTRVGAVGDLDAAAADAQRHAHVRVGRRQRDDGGPEQAPAAGVAREVLLDQRAEHRGEAVGLLVGVRDGRAARHGISSTFVASRAANSS